MIDLEKLREQAQDANTAEQWYAAHDMTSCSYDYDKAFIAACSPSVVIELLDHIAQLEKDAWRYRWMRSKATGDATLWESVMDGEGLYSMKCEDELDQAIDTAMESNHG